MDTYTWTCPCTPKQLPPQHTHTPFSHIHPTTNPTPQTALPAPANCAPGYPSLLHTQTSPVPAVFALLPVLGVSPAWHVHAAVLLLCVVDSGWPGGWQGWVWLHCETPPVWVGGGF